MSTSPEPIIDEREARRASVKRTERRRNGEIIGLGIVAAVVLFFPYVTEKSNVGIISFALVICLSTEIQKRWSLEDEIEALQDARKENVQPVATPNGTAGDG